jgi:predicted MFS family arabinose efflux permease
VGTAGGPEIQRDLSTSYAELTTLVLLVPGLISLVLDPPLLVLADRWSRRRMIAGGLAVMAVAAGAAAIAPGAITLALALAASSVAATAVVGLAEATLIDARPDARAATMTRWMLLGLIGDVAAPLLLVTAGALGAGWRGAYAALAVILAAAAIGIAARPIPPPPPAAGDAGDGDDGAPPDGLIATLRKTVRNRALVVWLAVLVLCDLLDEILVVLASLHLRDVLGAGPGWRTAVIAAFVGGGAIGLVVVERLLRRVAPLRLLAASATACAAAYVAWLCAPTPLASTILMVAVGATAAPLYPLTSAQAYAMHTGRAGAVIAVSHLFTPVALALPWLCGAVADRFGTWVALALLLAQPVGIAVMAARSARDSVSANRDN